MNILTYDCEIINAIPDDKTIKSNNINYCEGWHDHANMGISVIGASFSATGAEDIQIAFVEDEVYYNKLCKHAKVSKVFADKDYTVQPLSNFQTYLDKTDVLIGFNNQHFDDSLLKASGFTIPDTIKVNYDILAEVWEGCGLGREFVYPTHAGFSLGAICEVNKVGNKTGNGANAAILWQNGFNEKVIDYCMNDIKLTKSIYSIIHSKGFIEDPRVINKGFCYYNPNFKFEQIKVKTIKEYLNEQK